MGQDDGEEQTREVQVAGLRRWGMYWLISFHSLSVYLIRACIPYVVPFLVREFGFSEDQRAMMLSSFTPGYILTMIPGGVLTQLIGNKRMLSTTGYAIAALILLLPSAPKFGHLVVCATLALMGAMNGPFLPAHYGVKGKWAPHDASRSWAILVMTLGSTWATMVASWVTPWLSARLGWRRVPYIYGVFIGSMTILWHYAGANSPAILPRRRSQPLSASPPLVAGKAGAVATAAAATTTTTTTMTTTSTTMKRPVPVESTQSSSPPSSSVETATVGTLAAPSSAASQWQLVTVAPAVAMIGAQTAGMTISNGKCVRTG